MIIPDLLGKISIADGILKSVTVEGDTTTIAIVCSNSLLETICFDDCVVLMHAMYKYDLGEITVSQGSEFYTATINRSFDDFEIGTSVTTKYFEVNIYGVMGDDPVLTVIASEVRLL
jgi:hypothetical protein